MTTIFAMLIAAQATLAVVWYFQANKLIDEAIESYSQVKVGGGL